MPARPSAIKRLDSLLSAAMIAHKAIFEALWYSDLVIHGNSVWDYAHRAAEGLDCVKTLASLEEARELAEVEEHWRRNDPFLAMMQRRTRRSPLAETLLGLRQNRDTGG
jgi:hypothetical protein